MRGALVRNLLACLCLTAALLLAFSGPGILGRQARPAYAGVTHHGLWQLRSSGATLRIGVRGADRLTAAARREASIPDVVPATQPAALPAPQPAWYPAPAPVAPVPIVGAVGQEFSLINQDRAASGVRTLAWSAALARVAQYRAEDMLNRGYFSHYDPATGQLAFVVLLQSWGIPYRIAGENIAWSTDQSMAYINTLFMNSPEHRANILSSAFGRVGVGVAGNGSKVMVVEVFSS